MNTPTIRIHSSFLVCVSLFYQVKVSKGESSWKEMYIRKKKEGVVFLLLKESRQVFIGGCVWCAKWVWLDLNRRLNSPSIGIAISDKVSLTGISLLIVCINQAIGYLQAMNMKQHECLKVTPHLSSFAFVSLFSWFSGISGQQKEKWKTL